MQRLVQATDKVWMGGILKTRRLHTVYCLSESAMQEGVLDIKLMNKPLTGESQGKHRANSGRLHHWAEGLQKVHTRLLRETAEYPTCLVPLK